MAGVHAMMMNVGGGGGDIIEEGDLYLMSNGVTMAAKPSAAKGKWHSFGGKDFYVAIDSADLVSVVSVYKGLSGDGEVLANLTRDGQTKSIPLNQVVTTFVDKFDYLFDSVTTFNQLISSWDTCNVNSMVQMFRYCSVFNQPIDSWNTSNVIGALRMFYYATAFVQDISSWCVSKIKSKPREFDNAAPAAWTAEMKPKWGAPC